MKDWWIPPTLRGYRVSWLAADALAGLTLVAVALPSQMATARLAELPAVLGLYAFVAGSLLYALIGSNRHLSVGADSTIAPVLATGVGSIAAVGSFRYLTLMAFLALVVGASAPRRWPAPFGMDIRVPLHPGDHRDPRRESPWRLLPVSSRSSSG